MRVLEARECGHGILVEHDGYISPDDNKNIISEKTIEEYFLFIKPKIGTDSIYRLLSPLLNIFFGILVAQ